MMPQEAMYALMYPIGKFEAPEFIREDHILKWVKTIEETPVILHDLISSLSVKDLGLHYRPNGWSISQVIHHLSDSHSNALIRFKLALTEDTPTIKPYKEGLWVELADSKPEYVHHSKLLIESVHAKWLLLLNHMDIHDYHNKSYFHPESHKNFTLGEVLGLYDWHCRHHLEHIKQALKFKGEFKL